MKNLRRWLRPLLSFGILGAVCVGSASSPAQAGISGLEASILAPVLTGSDAAKYGSQIGFQGSILLDQPSIGPTTRWVGLVRYQPLSVTGYTNTNLGMIDAMIGITTWGQNALLGLKPSFGITTGLNYTFVSLPGSVNPIQGTYWMVEFTPGLEIPIFGPIALAWRAPITLIAHRPLVALFNQQIALRWNL